MSVAKTKIKCYIICGDSMNGNQNIAYIWKDEVSSTNDELLTLAKNGQKENTVLLAKSQSAGKGTNNRSFFSPENGVYMSILVRDVEKECLPFVTAFAAVCVSRTLNTLCGADTRIKPVNDVYIDGKKVCGILTKAQSSAGERADFVIIGIGINLFYPQNGFPEEIKDIAGAVLCDYDEKIYRAVVETVSESIVSGIHRLCEKEFCTDVMHYYREKEYLPK